MGFGRPTKKFRTKSVKAACLRGYCSPVEPDVCSIRLGALGSRLCRPSYWVTGVAGKRFCMVGGWKIWRLGTTSRSFSTCGRNSDVARKIWQSVLFTKDSWPSREFRGDTKSGTYPTFNVAASTTRYRRSFALSWPISQSRNKGFQHTTHPM